MVYPCRYDHIPVQRNESTCRRGGWPRQCRHVSFVHHSFTLFDHSMLVAEPYFFKNFTDTGIQVTNDVAFQIYSNTPGAQPISATQWSIPCNSTFPITLTFGGVPFTIVERDTIVRQSIGTCTGVVTGGATTIGTVGAPFMRNVYTLVVKIFYYAYLTSDDSNIYNFFADNLLQTFHRLGLSLASGSLRKSSARILPFLPQLQLQPVHRKRLSLAYQVPRRRPLPRLRRLPVVHERSSILHRCWG